MKKIAFLFLILLLPAALSAQSIGTINVDGTSYNDIQSLVNNPSDLLKAIQITAGEIQQALTEAYYSQVYSTAPSVVNAANTDAAAIDSNPFANLPANLQGTCGGSMANLADAQTCAAKAQAQGAALGYSMECSVSPITVNNITTSYYPGCTVNGSTGHSAYLLAGFDSNTTLLGHINPMWNSLPGTLAQQNNQTGYNYSSQQGLSSSNQIVSSSASSLSNTGLSGGSTSYSQSVSRLLSSAINTLNSAYQSAQSGSSQSGVSGNTSSNSSTCGATVNAPLLNVRQAPNTNGSIVGQLASGSTFTAVGLVEGENVEGTSQWWQLSNGNYIWAGGTSNRSTNCGTNQGSGSGTGAGTGAGAGTGQAPTNITTAGPVSARYIKVQSQSRSWVAWNEIEIYDTSGNKLTPVGATASCTWCRWTSANPGVGPEKAIDGNLYTMWNAGETNPACNWFGVSASDRAACGTGGQSAWIQIDLGSAHNISKIKMHTQNTPNPAQATHTVFVSANGSSFSQIANFIGLVTAGTWLEVNVQ